MVFYLRSYGILTTPTSYELGIPTIIYHFFKKNNSNNNNEGNKEEMTKKGGFAMPEMEMVKGKSQETVK